jgi:hypothetical protein
MSSAAATATTAVANTQPSNPATATIPNNITALPVSYASQMNAYYNSTTSNRVLLEQRFNDTVAALPTREQQWVQTMIQQCIAEFKRLHTDVNGWSDLTLAQSVYVPLAEIHIDTTMQRLLNLDWVANLLAKFKSTKVVPIQVYKDDDGKICAWDGQHTAVLLWLICTKVLGEDPNTVQVPVNIYPSSKKSEMRECFLDLNSSEGKRQLDLIDHWIQQVFGVRVDGSTNPAWQLTEQKQRLLEKYDLFVTHEKYNNFNMPGAISRLQEVNKLDLTSLEWLLQYLQTVTNSYRAVVEKEMVMMAHFFLRCRLDGIPVDAAYINRLATVALTAWNADFTPNGAFWERVTVAYHNWHQSSPANMYTNPRANKEPIHGFPFLIAQLHKSMPGFAIPRNTSNSNFQPLAGDLF